MAKKKVESANSEPKAEESVAGYFRKLFAENPQLLKERSNDKLLQRWLADHPGHTEVPQSVKGSLANIKSVLRSSKRKKAARRKQEANGQKVQVRKMTRSRTGGPGLEHLEQQIDECLNLARSADREGLESVIHHLRRARNEVVWKIGE
jgi:hypothetical protein